MIKFIQCIKCRSTQNYFTPGRLYVWCDNQLKNDRGFIHNRVPDSDPSQWALNNWYEFKDVTKEYVSHPIDPDFIDFVGKTLKGYDFNYGEDHKSFYEITGIEIPNVDLGRYCLEKNLYGH